MHHPSAPRRPLRSVRSLVALTSLVLAGSAVASGPASGAPQATTDATAVLAWNETVGRAAIAACIAPLDDPLHESRMGAMAHLAIHDALNAIDRRSRPYAADFDAPSDASVEAAVASAAHDVLVPAIAAIPAPFDACHAAGIAVVENAYTAALAAVPDGPSKTAGVAAGRHAAQAINDLRAGDGSGVPFIDPTYPQGTEPGEWRFTPGLPFAVSPEWAHEKPFALRSALQFGVAPPLALSSGRYAADLDEVKTLGADGVTTPTTRTAEQTEIAHFWWESSPLSWNRLARGVAESQGLDAWEAARLFALLDMALADGYVASFAVKYTDLFWRPVTAIREAADDGNARTSPDPTWTPLEVTPPIPDHDSGHAVEGGAATGVLRAFFGTDRMSFTHCSLTLPTGRCTDANPVIHRFTRFSEAAQENADSRVYIGFHFRYATEVGTRHGEQIGHWTATHYLQPVG